MTQSTHAKPHGTAWGAVLGGWLAAIGMTALLTPVVAAFLAGRVANRDDLSLAVPGVIGVMLAYLVGGYVAGRMAGYNNSWHGMMTAFFGLFVILALILLGVAADNGVFGTVRIGGVDPMPGTFTSASVGEALTFGAIIGFLAIIFAGWLGGLLAPDKVSKRHVHADAVPAGQVQPTTTDTRVSEKRRFRLLPSLGRKSGREETVVREERVDRS